MGTLTPVLGTLTKTLAAVQTISSTVDSFSGRDIRAQQNLAMRQLQQQQSLSQQQATAKSASDRAQIALDAKQTEDARRTALKRAIAKQNVNFGASGVSKSGSGEAVLLGLYNEADDDLNYNKSLDQLRYNAIDRGLYNAQQNNILKRNQLSEQQRLQRVVRGF